MMNKAAKIIFIWKTHNAIKKRRVILFHRDLFTKVTRNNLKTLVQDAQRVKMYPLYTPSDHSAHSFFCPGSEGNNSVDTMKYKT